jgi:uncharacterized surface protein with fasciclin (FAS1) repeats
MANVEQKAGTIVDLMNESGNFKTLSALLKEADLLDTLKGSGPFTVFAPTDDAFEKIPKKTRENLKQPASHDRLQRILKHHVAEGRKTGKDVGSASSIKMLDGTEVAIEASGKKIHVGEAAVTEADLEAGNGIVHVINKVLMPE